MGFSHALVRYDEHGFILFSIRGVTFYQGILFPGFREFVRVKTGVLFQVFLIGGEFMKAGGVLFDLIEVVFPVCFQLPDLA